MNKTEKINGTITKKARKYFYFHPANAKSEDYTQKLAVDEITKDFQVGDELKDLTVTITWGTSYTTGKCFVDFFTAADTKAAEKAMKEEAERKAAERKENEIERWFGYVVNAYANGTGYIYNRGAEKLREFGATEKLEKIEEFKKVIAERKAAEKAKYINLALSDYEGRWIAKGTKFERGGKVYEAVSVWHKYEDGFSFGAGSDEWYSVKTIDITDTEAGREIIAKKEAEEAERKAKAEQEQARAAAEQEIREDGELITEETTMAELEAGGEIAWNTMDVCGGGCELIFKKGEEIILICNNGGDGDDWSINTIRTGGAGAYGYRIKMENTSVKLIKNILKATGKI